SERERGAVAPGVLVERLLAVAAAEVNRLARELRAMLCGHAVDHHAADWVLRLDPDRRRRERHSFGGGKLRAAPVLDDLGGDADGDLLRRDGADVEPGGGLQSAEALRLGATRLQRLEDHRGPAAARDQADVAGAGR